MGIFDFADKEGNLSEKVTQVLSAAGVEGVSVEVADGVVTLSGNAATAADRDKALQLVKAVEGVTDVQDQIQIPASEQKKVHKVVYGDTLWGISEKYYGDGAQYMKIFEANKEVWKNYNYDPNVLYPDWELTIP
jgi:nucleoid-associated protein YgaU